MRKIREVLRLKYQCKRVHRDIAASVGISTGSVFSYLQRAKANGITWERAQQLDDAQLEARLFNSPTKARPPKRAPIDLQHVHQQLRKKGVTLQLLWLEYCDAVKEDGPPYQYSQFCDCYRAYKKQVDVAMRQVHRAGERSFVDYSGLRPSIKDKDTGKKIEVELFVGVLGASGYTYAEATRTQSKEDFIQSNIRMLEFFGGVPQLMVPDQLRSAVRGPDRYDPEINPTYASFARHYNTAILPARPRKPKDKAKVENAVQVAQRWILAALRHQTFFSIEALNAAIQTLLTKLNNRPFQKLEGSRRSMFEMLDQPALKPLPKTRFEIDDWKKVRVNNEYLVDYDDRLYSVPYTLARHRVEIRATKTIIEILYQNTCVAVHRRSYEKKGHASIEEAHRPEAHRQSSQWTPQRLIAWAQSIGPYMAQLLEQIIARRPHLEVGVRACLALIRDTKGIAPARLEAASKRALLIGAPSRKSVLSILKHHLEASPLPDTAAVSEPIEHENIRGPAYFDRQETGPSEPKTNVNSSCSHAASLLQGPSIQRVDERSTPKSSPEAKPTMGKATSSLCPQEEVNIDGAEPVRPSRSNDSKPSTPQSMADEVRVNTSCIDPESGPAVTCDAHVSEGSTQTLDAQETKS